jgi:hypothetical protein
MTVIVAPSEGLLMQRSEQAHSVAHGRILLDGPNNKLGYGRVRQEILPLKDVVKVMPD